MAIDVLSAPDKEKASDLVNASRRLVSTGMNRGSSGNVSVRSDKVFNGSGSFLTTPSGEWRMHRDIYSVRPDIHAVVHTHSPFATTLACMQLDVPPFHYMIAVTGGNTIPCAPYALFGSQELSDSALDCLENRYACLLAHHGMLALGHNLEHAMAIAIEVESLCEQYWRILQTGHLKILSEKQMNAVHEKFRDYFNK